MEGCTPDNPACEGFFGRQGEERVVLRRRMEPHGMRGTHLRHRRLHRVALQREDQGVTGLDEPGGVQAIVGIDGCLGSPEKRPHPLPQRADTPKRTELPRAPQGALPFPGQSCRAQRAPLAIGRTGTENGRVQGNPKTEGDGGERAEHRVLVQVLHGDGGDADRHCRAM